MALAFNGSGSLGSLLEVDLDELFMPNEGTFQDSALKDGLGSTVGLTNSAQTLTDKYSYEPYGAVTHTSGTNVNPYLFAGQMDDFSNLYFMRNRYYIVFISRLRFRMTEIMRNRGATDWKPEASAGSAEAWRAGTPAPLRTGPSARPFNSPCALLHSAANVETAGTGWKFGATEISQRLNK